MRSAFAEVFRQNNKEFNDHNCWTKIVSLGRVAQSLSFLSAQDEFNFLLGAQREHRRELYFQFVATTQKRRAFN